MKISLLLTEDGAQVTMTPENKTEESVLNFLHQEPPLDIAVRRAGEFALTQGGYFREFNHAPVTQSTMLVLTKSRSTGLYGTEEAPVTEPPHASSAVAEKQYDIRDRDAT